MAVKFHTLDSSWGDEKKRAEVAKKAQRDAAATALKELGPLTPAEKAAAEKAASEKAGTEKAAAENVAAEKAAAEAKRNLKVKAAAEKAAGINQPRAALISDAAAGAETEREG